MVTFIPTLLTNNRIFRKRACEASEAKVTNSDHLATRWVLWYLFLVIENRLKNAKIQISVNLLTGSQRLNEDGSKWLAFFRDRITHLWEFLKCNLRRGTDLLVWNIFFYLHFIKDIYWITKLYYKGNKFKILFAIIFIKFEITILLIV